MTYSMASQRGSPYAATARVAPPSVWRLFYIQQNPSRTRRRGGGRLDSGANLEVGEELDGALAGDEVVVDDAAEGEHGEAAVLDLLELEGLEVLRGGARAEHQRRGLL
jgi:hypothetical protein